MAQANRKRNVEPKRKAEARSVTVGTSARTGW